MTDSPVPQCADLTHCPLSESYCAQHDRPYRCANSTGCVSESRRCDGDKHCDHGDDETGCGEYHSVSIVMACWTVINSYLYACMLSRCNTSGGLAHTEVNA